MRYRRTDQGAGPAAKCFGGERVLLLRVWQPVAETAVMSASHAADAKLTDLMYALADCPRARLISIDDRCKARRLMRGGERMSAERS